MEVYKPRTTCSRWPSKQGLKLGADYQSLPVDESCEAAKLPHELHNALLHGVTAAFLIVDTKCQLAMISLHVDFRRPHRRACLCMVLSSRTVLCVFCL